MRVGMGEGDLPGESEKAEQLKAMWGKCKEDAESNMPADFREAMDRMPEAARAQFMDVISEITASGGSTVTDDHMKRMQEVAMSMTDCPGELKAAFPISDKLTAECKANVNEALGRLSRGEPVDEVAPPPDQSPQKASTSPGEMDSDPTIQKIHEMLTGLDDEDRAHLQSLVEAHGPQAGLTMFMSQDIMSRCMNTEVTPANISALVKMAKELDATPDYLPDSVCPDFFYEIFTAVAQADETDKAAAPMRNMFRTIHAMVDREKPHVVRGARKGRDRMRAQYARAVSDRLCVALDDANKKLESATVVSGSRSDAEMMADALMAIKPPGATTCHVFKSDGEHCYDFTDSDTWDPEVRKAAVSEVTREIARATAPEGVNPDEWDRLGLSKDRPIVKKREDGSREWVPHPLTEAEKARLVLAQQQGGAAWTEATHAIKGTRNGKYPPDWHHQVIQKNLWRSLATEQASAATPSAADTKFKGLKTGFFKSKKESKQHAPPVSSKSKAPAASSVTAVNAEKPLSSLELQATYQRAEHFVAQAVDSCLRRWRRMATLAIATRRPSTAPRLPASSTPMPPPSASGWRLSRPRTRTRWIPMPTPLNF